MMSPSSSSPTGGLSSLQPEVRAAFRRSRGAYKLQPSALAWLELVLWTVNVVVHAVRLPIALVPTYSDVAVPTISLDALPVVVIAVMKDATLVADMDDRVARGAFASWDLSDLDPAFRSDRRLLPERRAVRVQRRRSGRRHDPEPSRFC
jgi:hypothetical protein